MRARNNRGRNPALGGRQTMIFVGESDALLEVFGLAREAGVVPVEQPDPDLMCVVADEDVLGGLCTPMEEDVLRRARGLGVPCLDPRQAHVLLASAAHRAPLVTS